MIQRFRNSSRALGRASKVELLLNNPNEACLARSRRDAENQRNPVLGDVLPSAAAEFYRNDYRAAIMLLFPYFDEIVESPMVRRESWRILFQSLLHENRIEEA